MLVVLDLRNHLYLFLKTEITELRDIITQVALEISTTNLSIFLLQKMTYLTKGKLNRIFKQ